MKNLALLALLLFSSLSQAAEPSPTPTPLPPILSADQVSGYTRMETSFQTHCQLSPEGDLLGVLFEHRLPDGQWNQITPFQAKLTIDELNLVKRLITTAQVGPFVKGPAVCDTGTVAIIARGNQLPYPFPILIAPDCEESIINQSPAAAELVKWIVTHCKIKY
jgi:hypothetical protein